MTCANSCPWSLKTWRGYPETEPCCNGISEGAFQGCKIPWFGTFPSTNSPFYFLRPRWIPVMLVIRLAPADRADNQGRGIGKDWQKGLLFGNRKKHMENDSFIGSLPIGKSDVP